MSRKIMVTGATGFVGRHLVPVLLSSGANVIAPVRAVSASLGSDVDQRVLADLSSQTRWNQYLNCVDVIVHLAARAHMNNERASDPLQAFRETNLHATMHLARQAASMGIRRFIFVSSIGVNGSTTHGKAFSESDTPAPAEPYAVSKAEAEASLRELGLQSGMEITIIRPVLVYGEDAPGNFGRLLKLAASRAILPLACIRNQRSFVSADNLANLLAVCINHPKAANETFLAADGEDVSTPGLLRKLGDAMDKPARLFPFPRAALTLAAKCLGKSGQFEKLVGSLQVDITKSRQLLGWKPPLSLDEGLKRAGVGYIEGLGKR